MLINSLSKMIARLPIFQVFGTVKSIQGLLIIAKGQTDHAQVGKTCQITRADGTFLIGEIVGFEGAHILIMPYGNTEGVSLGAVVNFTYPEPVIAPCQEWLGRVMDGCCNPLDNKGLLPQGDTIVALNQSPPPSHSRQKVTTPIDVGVKAVNTFLTMCKGQRMGIFAGSGVGKSVLLSMLARNTACDICVIGLIGERGREVRDFIEDTLGEEGLKKSVLVVATSDEPPLLRRRAAQLTLAIAEYFRDQGKSVLCLMDSVTRLAMAQREIGLSAGEPPTTKGYTPSVFVELAKIMERAGPGIKEGSITAFFTVLVDGDDHNEPIADAARGILDGHIVLDRHLAEQSWYPAINILRSLSRTVPGCHTPDQQKLVRRARQILSTYDSMGDMIRLGAYRPGSDPAIDEAIALLPDLRTFLNQTSQENIPLPLSFEQLSKALGTPK